MSEFPDFSMMFGERGMWPGGKSVPPGVLRSSKLQRYGGDEDWMDYDEDDDDRSHGDGDEVDADAGHGGPPR